MRFCPPNTFQVTGPRTIGVTWVELTAHMSLRHCIVDGEQALLMIYRGSGGTVGEGLRSSFQPTTSTFNAQLAFEPDAFVTQPCWSAC